MADKLAIGLMVVCASGSAPLAGKPARIYVDNAFLASLLPPELQWLGPFLPYIPPQTMTTATLCSVDPPGNPAPLTADEIFEVISGFMGGATGGLFAAGFVAGNKIIQYIHNYAWYKLCQCNTGPTPAAPAGPAAPVGLPLLNPTGVVSAPTSTPCASYNSAPLELPAGASYYRGGPTGQGKNVTATRVQMTNAIVTGVGARVIFQWTSLFADGAAGDSLLPDTTLTPNTSKTIYLPFNPAKPNLQCRVSYVDGTGTSSAAFLAEMFCNGDVPGGPVSACCPPDPMAAGLLAQVLKMVTLIQRQIAPFSYVLGTVRAGLSGSGSFAIQGLLGLEVLVTTIPPQLGRDVETPSNYYGMGDINVGTVDGFKQRIRVEHNQQMIPIEGYWTNVSYNFAPGVIATITEVKREL